MEDFRSVVRSAPDLYLLLAPDLTIVEVSDAYVDATMTTREEILGRGVFEVFPDDPAEQAPDGVANLRASLHRVLQDRRPHAMAVQRYPIRRPATQGGEFEERFWRPLNRPVLGDDGSVRYIIHRVEDVTDVVRLHREKLELDRMLRSVEIKSRRYRELVDHAPDAMVIVGEDTRIRLVNLQTEILFGYTREELIDQPLEILIPERFRRNHRGHLSRFFTDPVSRPMGARLELYGRRKDASEIPIEVSLSPQRDDDGITVSASIRDISERRRYEAEARLAADRLRSAVDSIQDAFALFDADDRLIMCNSVFRRLVHAADPERIVGKSYAEVLDAWINDIDFGDEAARERFRYERVARRHVDPSPTFDVRMRDGRSLRIVDRRTAENGIVKTIWDITDDERRAAELREARAAAEAASAAKSEFLSSMSHELRTPLNAVLGFAQLLIRDRREPLSERHSERVEHILGSGRHLLRLIDDVLDLSKIEAGRISLSPEPVAVNDVIAEVTRTLEPIATRQKVMLEVLPLPANLPMVIADRTRFAQILMNFGSNAVKYNRPDGRIRVQVSTPSTDAVRVTVADTGIGIPLEKQAKLFQIADIDFVAVPTAELGIAFASARHPELVLMDIHLPGMSGLDALRALRSEEETRSIPVIALTAAASDRDRRRGMEAGFYRYLSKPANVDELIEAIDSVLKG